MIITAAGVRAGYVERTFIGDAGERFLSHGSGFLEHVSREAVAGSRRPPTCDGGNPQRT